MLTFKYQHQQLACWHKDYLKSCPEAVSGLGVLRCSKTSEGNSLTKRIFGVSNAANSNLSDLQAHKCYFIGSDYKSFFKASVSVQAGLSSLNCILFIFFTLYLFLSCVTSHTFSGVFIKTNSLVKVNTRLGSFIFFHFTISLSLAGIYLCKSLSKAWAV